MRKGIVETNGNYVRELRLKRNLPHQEDLAKLADVSVTKISHIETGKGARPDVIALVAKALGVQFNDLLLHPLPERHYGPDEPISSAFTDDLPFAGHATYDHADPNVDIARRLVSFINQLLIGQPGIVKYDYERLGGSMWIGMRAPNTMLNSLVVMFSRFDFNRLPLSASMTVRIDRLYFPRRTLDWPLEPMWLSGDDLDGANYFDKHQSLHDATLRALISRMINDRKLVAKPTKTKGLIVRHPRSIAAAIEGNPIES